MNYFPTLRTKRLVLRQIVATDVDAILRIHGDEVHMALFGTDPISSRGQAIEVIEKFASWRTQKNPGTRWGIERSSTPGLVGTCGLFGWNREWKKCAIGYELAPEVCGHGFMLEAVRAVLDWGFESMQLNRVEAQVHELNASSRKLLDRLGFVYEGRLRQVAFWGGSHHDLLQYSLLSSERGSVA